jgi:hypothetical protein
MKTTTILLRAAAFLYGVVRIEGRTIDLPLYGFKIDAWAASPGSMPGTALIMFLRNTEGRSIKRSAFFMILGCGDLPARVYNDIPITAF